MAYLARARSPAPPAAGSSLLPQRLAARVRTGCIYERQPRDTYPILVMRSWPRRLPRWAVREWWPTLAPSMGLLHAPRTDGTPMRWDDFVVHYLAELDALSTHIAIAYTLRLGFALQRYPTVTLLAAGRDRCGEGERAIRCQRRVLRAWLVGEVEALQMPATHEELDMPLLG